jgi:ABC-type transporter Mla MlaB component
MPAAEPQTIAVAIHGPLSRADLPGLCERVCALLRPGGACLALCDVSGIAADAVAVEALARLQLAARRQRCQLRVRHASAELLDLVSFIGLRDVLPE